MRDRSCTGSTLLGFVLCVAAGGTGNAALARTVEEVPGSARFHPGTAAGAVGSARATPSLSLRIPPDRAPGKSAQPGGWTVVSDAGLYYGHDGRGPSLACTAPGEVAINIRTRRRLRGQPQERPDGLPFWPGELSIVSGAESLSAPAKMFLSEADGMVTIIAGIDADAPVLAEFARTGHLEVSALGDRRRPRPAPVDAVNRVLNACREPTA